VTIKKIPVQGCEGTSGFALVTWAVLG
jgi:hypothetical protein